MRLVRRWAGPGVGESALYAPVRFELSFDEQSHTVDAWDRLEYENTHHNWNDSLEARTDDLALFYNVRWNNGLTHTVRAVRISDGAEVLAETEIQVE